MLNEKGYVISRIINNNVVASHDKDSEIVLMGSGISFKKKVGDFVDKDKVEKEFVLKGREKTRYMDIIENINSDFIDLAVNILDYAEEQLGVKTTTIAYISLADHLANAVERAQNHILLPNQMLNEVKRFYPNEFAIGLKAIRKANELYEIELPLDEAGFIAFHILNLAGVDINKPTSDSVMLIKKVIEIVETYFEFTLDQESVYYERFLTHLKYFSSRVFAENDVEYGDKDFVYRMMKVQYPETTKCVELISEYLDFNYKIEVNNEEKGYLIIHINNLLDKSKIVTKPG
ncbi:BglG family transcriptional antiterminator [Breznakia blatticola]|uniref:BglG family transcriptional antiterminator n=1 Tax=Breznakia blatticola TaxID=1754012 RepID=A0A4R7ZML1_9FIRM|nr:PRD domain-containing protein [Breznakia blatticola]TDW16450.1 BglG family transcriptional antiterminator [Breznakia blatticola]